MSMKCWEEENNIYLFTLNEEYDPSNKLIGMS
jgi:hypothetical protein